MKAWTSVVKIEDETDLRTALRRLNIYLYFIYIRLGQRARLSAFVRKLIRFNYLPDGFDSFDTLCDRADSALFLAVLNNPSHTLHSLLPPVKSSIYSLRPRPHNREIPRADTLSRKTFILRMLYLGI